MPAFAWLPWALGAAVFAALTAIFGKIGVRDLDADYATLLRTLVVAVCLTILVLATGKWSDPTKVAGGSAFFLVLSGVASGASWLCYFRALKSGEVARVAPVDKLSVVIATLFAVVFLGERLGSKDWIGIAMVGLGVVLLALPH